MGAKRCKNEEGPRMLGVRAGPGDQRRPRRYPVPSSGDGKAPVKGSLALACRPAQRSCILEVVRHEASKSSFPGTERELQLRARACMQLLIRKRKAARKLQGVPKSSAHQSTGSGCRQAGSKSCLNHQLTTFLRV